MTVDDDTQELVVKVNNTLKRVSANSGATTTRSPATSQTNTNNSTATWTFPTASTNTENNNSNNGAQIMDDSGRGSDRSSPAPSGPPSHSSSKRSGRKAAKPTKLQPQKVYDEEHTNNMSEDDISVNETDLVTSTPALVKHKPMVHGSAKRKAQVQHRVLPDMPSREDSPSLVIDDVRTFAETMGVNMNGSNDDSNFSETGSRNDDSQPAFIHGGSVYTAGTVEGPSGPVVDIDAAEISSDSHYGNHMNGMPSSPGQQSNSYGRVYIEVGNEFIQVKEQGRDGSTYDSPLNLTPDSFGNGDQSTGPSSELRSRLENNNPDEGLSIKYTNMGPFTVNNQGRDVSQVLTKRPDFEAIAGRDYDETLAYMEDALGATVGRKKRRRVGEEELTAEEVAEYTGSADADGDTIFKCKFCSMETSDVQKYVQHTMGSHHTYVCHQCGKCFTTKSSLLRHRPIHTGMRRFACSICKKTFYRKDKCKAHIKRHLGPDQNPDPFATTTALHDALDEIKPPPQFVIDANEGVPSPSLGIIDAS